MDFRLPTNCCKDFINILMISGEVVEFEKTLEDIEVKETSSVEMNVETSEETANVQWYKVSQEVLRYLPT